jgi:hypothetical protein
MLSVLGSFPKANHINQFHIFSFLKIWVDLIKFAFNVFWFEKVDYMIIFYLTLFKSSNLFLFMTANTVLESGFALQYL